MVYKKYIKRGGKTFGPYYYESYREGDKVKTRFVKGPSKKDRVVNEIKDKKHLITLFSGLIVVIVFLLCLIFINSEDGRSVTGNVVGIGGVVKGFFDRGLFYSGGGLLFVSEASPNVSWNATHDSGGTDEVHGIDIDSSGNVYVTGGWDGSGFQWLTAKYNSSGGQVLNNSEILGVNDIAYDLVVDSSNNVYVTGNNDSGINSDFRTYKYNSAGGHIWNTSSNGGDEDVAYGIALDSSNNSYITGTNGSDYYTIKYNSTGGHVWTVTYDSGGTDIAYSIAVDSSNNSYVTGNANNNYYTIKYDSSGNHIWNVTYDSGGNIAYSIAVDSSNNSYVTGTDGSDYYTIKYNSTGGHAWNVTYDSGGADAAYGIALDSSNNIYVTGDANSDYYTIKYNSTGGHVWNATYDGGNADIAYDIAVDDDGYIYVTGSRNNGADTDFFTIKYNNNTGGSGDSTPPTVTIITPTDNTNHSNTGLNINYTASDETALDSCWYSNDSMATNKTLTDCSTNITTITWSEGQHNVTVWANDSSGNEASDTVTFTIDSTAPTVSITYPTNTTYCVNVSDLNYTINEAGGVCWYSIDSGTTNSSTVSARTNFTGVTSSEGGNSWNVYCNDSFGNEASDSVDFAKDTGDPTISIVYPLNTSYSINVSNLNYTISESGGKAWYSIDSGVTNSSSVSAGTNFTSVTSSEDSNTWNLYANDSCGNEASDSVVFTVDSTPPNVTINYPTNTTYTAASINFNVTAVDETGMGSCWYSLSSGTANNTMTNSVTNDYTHTNSSVPNGGYLMNAYCNDSSGNLNDSESISFAINVASSSDGGGGGGGSGGGGKIIPKKDFYVDKEKIDADVKKEYTVTIRNTENQSQSFNIFISEELKDLVSISNEDFTLGPNKEKTIKVSILVSEIIEGIKGGLRIKTSDKEKQVLITITPQKVEEVIEELELCEWSECRAVYTLDDLIDENIFLKGEQEKICEFEMEPEKGIWGFAKRFANKIISVFRGVTGFSVLDKNTKVVEKRECDPGIEIETKKIKKCFKEYVEVYDLVGNLISSMESINEGHKKLNLDFSSESSYTCEKEEAYKLKKSWKKLKTPAPKLGYILLTLEYNKGNIDLISKSCEKGFHQTLNHDLEKEFRINSYSKKGELLYSASFDSPGNIFSDSFEEEEISGGIVELEKARFYLIIPGNEELEKIIILRKEKKIFEKEVNFEGCENKFNLKDWLP